HNAQYQRGQLSSIHAGLALAEKFGAGAAIIHPVDHPRVSSKTIRLLAEAASTALIAIPIFENKRGHPVGFSSSLFDELFAAPDDVGARAVVRNHEKDIVEVAADDPGILNNIDTPEQYERLRANLRNIEK
ncbi:MAG TPA: NTP transferase domain-containing protein, partial [Bacteroidota bacterium]|nr:NTP transferase domain-containing protein [Bacteroidota bacterium]